ALAFCILFAAVLTEPRSERILGQAGQLPEREPTENPVRGIDILVYSRDVFINISASAGCFNEIVGQSAIGGQRYELEQESRRGVNSIAWDDIASERCARTRHIRICRTRRVHRQRIIERYSCRRKIPVALRRSWDSGGEHRACP